MLYGDEAVVVLEDGPFKFTASCKTVDYDYSYYNSSSSFSPMPSSYYPTMSSDYNSSTTYTWVAFVVSPTRGVFESKYSV